jgi:hypothetical protein
MGLHGLEQGYLYFYFLLYRNRVAQLYPQALDSLSVASYDSQGYGGSIRPRLHTGYIFCPGKIALFILRC